MTNSSFANNTLTLNLTYSGYAIVYRARKAFLVLRNTTTNVEYSVEISSDIRTWKKGTAIQLTKDVTGSVPAGNYQLFLNLPDPSISNPLYSIRCANTGTWDATKGFNNLNQTVAVTGGTSSNPVVTDPVLSNPVVTNPVVITPTLAVEILFVNNSTLVITNLPSQNFTIRVFNLSGRIRARSTDLSGLRSGYYVVKVYCNGQEYTKNIFKQ
jgi:hypothetical protein